MRPVRAWRALALALVCAVCAAGAFAQAYPSKPIRLIIPGAPGAATDIRGRWLPDQLVRTLGQPIVVDNRFGAGGSIATGAAAKSAPAPSVIRKAGIKAE